MMTVAEQVRTELHAAAGGQPFVPDVSGVWAAGRRRVRRDRAKAAAGGLLVALALGGAVAVWAPGQARHGTVPAAGGPGRAGFSVERQTGPGIEVPCAFQVVVDGAPAVRTGGQPCGAGAGGLDHAPSREDRVVLDGHPTWVTTGSVPTGTIRLTAVGDDVQQEAQLRPNPWDASTVFVFLTRRSTLTHLTLTLADGRVEDIGSVSTPGG